MEQSHYWIIAGELAGIAVLTAAEHATLGRLWKRYELARRATGIGTVFALMLPAALLGILDMTTFVILALGFIVAGAVLGGMVTCERSAVNRKAKRELDGGEGRSGPQLPG